MVEHTEKERAGCELRENQKKGGAFANLTEGGKGETITILTSREKNEGL